MVFEYMDHDLTGLADRPGMRFSVPQIKVLQLQLFQGSNVFWLTLLLEILFNSFFLTVLYEAAVDWTSLLSC